jgi:hypothetical protein
MCDKSAWDRGWEKRRPRGREKRRPSTPARRYQAGPQLSSRDQPSGRSTTQGCGPFNGTSQFFIGTNSVKIIGAQPAVRTPETLRTCSPSPRRREEPDGPARVPSIKTVPSGDAPSGASPIAQMSGAVFSATPPRGTHSRQKSLNRFGASAV